MNQGTDPGRERPGRDAGDHCACNFLAPLFVAGLLACYAGPGDREEVHTVPAKTIEEVLATHTDSLMALPGVVGTAIGLCDEGKCIRVLLADSSTEARRKIPAEIEGYPVTVDVTGPIRPRRPRKG